MTHSRELERKYVVDMNSVAAEFRLNVMFPGAESTLRGRSKDIFWEAPGVDFIRLRENTRELTIKITDKDTIEDRVEENVVVSSLSSARRLLGALHGLPTIEIWKNYYVLKLGNCHISLYTVDGLNQVFLEVEANNLNTVREVSKSIEHFLPIKQEMRSLYTIAKEAA